MSQQYVYGIHAATTFLEKNPENAMTLFIAKDRKDARIKVIVDLARSIGLSMEFSTTDKLDQLSQNGVHQGIVLLCKIKTYQESDLEFLLASLDKPLLLVLDSIQDPHNLGACLRTAAAAGVDLVIIPKDRSATITPLVRKIASGAAELIPIVQVTNLRRAMQIAQEHRIWFVGLTVDETAKSIYQMKLTGPLGLVLGSEGKGLRDLTQKQCDELAYIPMPGDIESLNVSVATGIALFEAVRQRIK
jgi:23S rRNA (guanosine2251-2'-O)-methyltransferase